jgi:hypothetical protein
MIRRRRLTYYDGRTGETFGKYPLLPKNLGQAQILILEIRGCIPVVKIFAFFSTKTKFGIFQRSPGVKSLSINVKTFLTLLKREN